MDIRTEPRTAPGPLPAQRFDASGRAHIDLRAVLALALPLVANSAVQMLLNLTDVWFVGHISTEALAGVGAVQWLVLVVVMILGAVGMAVQTLVAQAYGARRYLHASQALWTALWGILLVAPLFVLTGLGGRLMLAPFGFDPRIETLAADFWLPRVAGSCFGAAVWAVMGFFNGIGRPRVTVLITSVVVVANAAFNSVFVFRLGWGV
ncbi:MAG: MATE family efflux transporter, partial [Steroidobacteraceae bacterium]|nr:MATE family efflux transporter [Steroidobacteraceae bacterium]